MILDTGPIVSFGELPILMSVSEIEEFAPSINSDIELPDDVTLAEALAEVGGLSAYCTMERERRRREGLST